MVPQFNKNLLVYVFGIIVIINEFLCKQRISLFAMFSENKFAFLEQLSRLKEVIFSKLTKSELSLLQGTRARNSPFRASVLDIGFIIILSFLSLDNLVVYWANHFIIIHLPSFTRNSLYIH